MSPACGESPAPRSTARRARKTCSARPGRRSCASAITCRDVQTSRAAPRTHAARDWSAARRTRVSGRLACASRKRPERPGQTVLSHGSVRAVRWRLSAQRWCRLTIGVALQG
eukprot:11570-Chlamydomonas_euryale.AAC.1